MEIKVGDYEVHASGTVIGNETEPIEFVIDKGSNYVLRLIFIRDPNQKPAQVKADRYGNNGLQITFINADNSLGLGNTAAVKVGRLNGRELYFNYRIYSLNANQGGKHIHYTFLLGKRI